MANTHETLTGLFTDIAGAIRSKTGGTGAIVADQFPEAIAAIDTQENLDSELSAQDSLIAQINTALAGKVGKELPVLSNPAGAANIEAGYQAIDGSGNLLVGAMKCYTNIETIYDGTWMYDNQDITLDANACYIVTAATYYSSNEYFHGVIKNNAFVVSNMPVGSKYWTFKITNGVLKIDKSLYGGYNLSLTKIS